MAIELLDLGSAIAVPVDAAPELLAEMAPATHPLALLPVRLETRFFARPDGSCELRVRVFPDQIHIDNHDPRLSQDELDLGRRYWEARWRAADDAGRLRGAWRMLVDRVEPARAAWIARRLEPTNQGDRPTTPLGGDEVFTQPPQFPDVGEIAVVTRTPRAGGLPSRWTVTAYRGGQVLAAATGRDIVDDLAVGPDIDDALAPSAVDPAIPEIDEGMRWMVDFERAETVGMAVRLPLATPVESAVIDVLVVCGVDESEATDGADRLAALLDAHHYSDGLAVIAPGTATNNTTEQRAGYASRDARGEQTFAIEWPDPPPELGPATAAARIGAGFGFDDAQVSATLGRIAAAADEDERLAAAMQTAVWPSTWGYYLAQFTDLDDAARDWVRDHARDHLRPAGSLPTLRCGRQPYGLLPVTTLAAPTGDGAGPAERLRMVLAALRDQVWRPATFGAARIGRTDDVGADLADVLRGDAASTDYAMRRALGPHYLRNLRRFLGDDLDAIGLMARLQQLTTGLPGRLGVPAPSLAGFVYEGARTSLAVPLVRTADSTDQPGSLNYVAALLAADPDALARPVPTDAVPLLHALLRHGLLREHAAAARLLAAAGQPPAPLTRDAELIGLVPEPAPTPTWSSQRALPAPGSDPAITIGEHLDALTDFTAPEVRQLGEFREALAQLADADPAAVERLLPPVLDAAAYRLDAWVTSLAARRLGELRDAQPTGVRLGGYGWVEQLRFQPRTPIADVIPDEVGPLTAEPGDPGFILAPSLTQAGTAALLREAHIAHGGGDNSPFAIKLTSDRVRAAERLFDGVRQGLALGVLLGYDVERRLHDVHLDEFIDDLRRIAPEPGTDGEQAVAMRRQLDGLELQRQWRADPDAVLAQIAGLPAGDARRERLALVLRGLDDAVDAAADAVTAESIYQLARGNLGRATTLDDVAGGLAPPPQLEFMRTPRSGTPITHRVAIVVDATAEPAPDSGWAGGSTSPRARAEPRLDAWAAATLGPATGIDVVVAELGTDGASATQHRVPLPDLALSALDLVWIAGDPGGANELAERAYAVAVPGGGPATLLRLDLAPGTDRTQRDLADLLELAGGLRRLIAGARPLDGADLQPAHADPDRRADLDELEARVVAGQRALADRGGALEALLDDQSATLGAFRSELTAIARFGIAGGLVRLAGADTDPALPGSVPFISATAVAGEVTRRLAEAEREAAAPPDEPEPARSERLLRRLRAVFGPGFVAVPVFTASTAADLDAGRRSPALLDGDPLAPYTWITRMERVRPALARMTAPLRLAEVLGTAPGLDLDVAHVPHANERPWIALSLADDGTGVSPDGLLSVVLQGAAGVDLSRSLAGLLVDEWTEVVPSRTETAGLAFRYDPPDAMAPQAVLLAVPPDPAVPWTVGSLNRVLLETLDLAHIRAVGPEAVDAVGHYLPATMLAFNVDGDAVSTDPNALTGTTG